MSAENITTVDDLANVKEEIAHAREVLLRERKPNSYYGIAVTSDIRKEVEKFLLIASMKDVYGRDGIKFWEMDGRRVFDVRQNGQTLHHIFYLVYNLL